MAVKACRAETGQGRSAVRYGPQNALDMRRAAAEIRYGPQNTRDMRRAAAEIRYGPSHGQRPEVPLTKPLSLTFANQR